MSSWSKKIEENWFLEILKVKGFYQEKKLSKNLYFFSYPLESFNISCLVYIYTDKTMNTHTLKDIFVDIYPYFKSIPYHLLILPFSVSTEVQKQAQELEIHILPLSELLLSLFPLPLYQNYLKQNYHTADYMIPWLYESHTRLEFSIFTKKLKESKEGLMIIEGDKGIGKTTFLQYLSYTLGHSIEKTQEHWLIPFYISMQSFKSEMTLEQYIQYQIFHSELLGSFSKESFHILLKYHKIVLIIDSVEYIAEKSKSVLEDFFKVILDYIALGAKVILSTPVYYFFYTYQKKWGLQYYFSQYLGQTPIIRYEIKPFTLHEIKQYNENPKIQNTIEYNETLKKLAKYPSILELFKLLSLEQLRAIDHIDSFFQTLLAQWKAIYLTLLGKETLLEWLAESILNQEKLDFEHLPSYIENFVLTEFRDSDLSLTLIMEELEACPIIIKHQDHFYFKHPILMFYFIKSKILLEFKRNNLQHITYLKHTVILELLSLADIEEIILPSLAKEIELSSLQPKGDLLVLWINIQQFLNQKESKIPITLGNLSHMALNYQYFGSLVFKDNQLSQLKSYYNDFRYTEWKNTNLDFAYFRYSYLGFTIWENNSLNSIDWKYIVAQEAKFYKQTFNEGTVHFSYLPESSFHSCLWIDCTLENNDFTKSEWIGVEHRQTILAFNNYTYSHFTSSEFRDAEYTHIIFSNTWLKENVWQDLTIKKSNFSKTHYEHTLLDTLEIKESTFAFSIWTHTTLKNIRFIDCDLRGVSFIDCHLTNVEFIDCDIRDMMFKEKTLLCENTKVSLANNQFLDL